MHPAAARRFGAPTPSIRASGLALAAGVTAGTLALLALGLSMHAIRTIERGPLVVDLLPAKERVPPREPVPSPPRHETRHGVEALAPARLAPAPAQRMETTFVATAPPAPAESAAAGTGTGAGGNGDGPGGGGPGGNSPPVIKRPAEWVVRPSNAQLMPYNPPRAAREYVNGVADLSCKVLRTQRLKDCRIVSERPRGYGFGRAALNAVPIFRINPPMRGDMALEDEPIVFSVAFNNRRHR